MDASKKTLRKDLIVIGLLLVACVATAVAWNVFSPEQSHPIEPVDFSDLTKPGDPEKTPSPYASSG